VQVLAWQLWWAERPWLERVSSATVDQLDGPCAVDHTRDRWLMIDGGVRCPLLFPLMSCYTLSRSPSPFPRHHHSSSPQGRLTDSSHFCRVSVHGIAPQGLVAE
jgi:hypothetical protein